MVHQLHLTVPWALDPLLGVIRSASEEDVGDPDDVSPEAIPWTTRTKTTTAEALDSGNMTNFMVVAVVYSIIMLRRRLHQEQELLAPPVLVQPGVAGLNGGAAPGAAELRLMQLPR